jgi:uncharacterized lipoprotein YmbA
MMRTPFLATPAMVIALVAALVVALTGCASSPAPVWHSLVPAAPAAAAAAASAPLTVSVAAVTVPQEVDRVQLVLRSADGTPSVLEQERWAEPLKAQLPRALALSLAPRLPRAVVVTSAGGTLALPSWRVVVDVQRFELQRGAGGDRAVLRAVWELRPGSARDNVPLAAPPQVFELAVPAAGGSSAALVAAMAVAVDRFSGQMSQSLCALGAC